MDATARFLAIVAVAAFVTERILATIQYVVNAVRQCAQSSAGEWFRAERWKVFLFVIAAVIGYVVVDYANLRLLEVLQVKVSQTIDFWLTWLVVVAGADRVHSMLGGEGGEKGETPVVRIEVDGDVRGMRHLG